MSSLFGGGPKTPTPTPQVDRTAIAAAGDAERRRNQQRVGKAASMLHGGQGVTSTATIGTKTLLGE